VLHMCINIHIASGNLHVYTATRHSIYYSKGPVVTVEKQIYVVKNKYRSLT